MAVLPTPGSPISTGLFLVRRARIWMVRRISSSRPITGSSLPSRAERGHVARVFLQRVEIGFGVGAVHGAALADVSHGLLERRRGDAGVAQRAAGRGVAARRCATSSRSWATNWSPALVAACCAASSTRTSSGVICGWPAPSPAPSAAARARPRPPAARPAGCRPRRGSGRRRRPPRHPAAP